MKWLSSRLLAEVGPADLESTGYILTGGRLLPSSGQRAGLYMYADKDDQRLTLYIRQMDGDKKHKELECRQEQELLSVCTWQGEKMLYFLTGSPDLAKHKTISEMAAAQLKN